MKNYRCLYNHEMLITFITQSPKLSFEEDVTDEYIRSFVEELADTQVDCFMLCPTAWRCVLWPSEVDPRWANEDFDAPEPGCWTDLKFYHRAFWRIRRYMKRGVDPIALTVDALGKQDLDYFISYRMNDNHYAWDRECPTHDKFALSHPEFAIDPSGPSVNLSYYYPEVRKYYLSLLRELCVNYRPKGIELDFLRSPLLFRDDQLPEGIGIINDFVAEARSMLDDLGEKQGGRLGLSVRVPHNLEECRAVGLDPVQWDSDSLVDMLNVSPHFVTAIEPMDIAGFKKEIRNTRVYAESCHHTGMSKNHVFGNNILRKTTPLQYETAAHSFLSRGADGISFFNFAYCRDNSLGEPRRRAFPGIEPRFDILKTIIDKGYLAKRPKHYFLNDGHGDLPVKVAPTKSTELTLTIDADPNDFAFAMLKVETLENLHNQPFDVFFNGVQLEKTYFTGEFFVPETFEGLPPQENTFCYLLRLSDVKKGENAIKLENNIIIGWIDHAFLTCSRVELALYPGKPAMFY